MCPFRANWGWWQSHRLELCLGCIAAVDRAIFAFLTIHLPIQNYSYSSPHIIPICPSNPGAADKTACVAGAYGNTLRFYQRKARPPLNHHYNLAA